MKQYERNCAKRKPCMPRNTKLGKKEILVFAAVLIAYIFLQMPTLSNPAWEIYNSWRQTDTYSIAVNYVQYDWNLLRPQLNYDSVSGSYIQLELQILTYISAILFRLLHVMTPMIPRVLSLLFFLGSAAFLYRIARCFVSIAAALFTAMVYLMLPLSLLSSRAIMPESCALFFYCGGVFFLLRWMTEDSAKDLWLSAACTAIAIMEKIPVAFIGFLVLFVLIRKLKKRCLKSPLFYGYGLASLLPPMIYYRISAQMAESKVVDAIATKHAFTTEIFAIFTSEGIGFFQSNLPKYIGVPVMLLAVIGLCRCFRGKRWFLAVWAISMILECITIVAMIRFAYYLVFILPIAAMLCGIAAQELFSWQRIPGLVVCVLVLCITVYSGVTKWKEMTALYETMTAASSLIQETTEQDDAVAISSSDPSYLNAANRRGMRANLNLDGSGASPADEIASFRSQGIAYFAVIGDRIYHDTDGSYLQYLKEHYDVIAQNDVCRIYELK